MFQVNPANVPSNVKLSLPQQQSATAVPEVKKVKRKDPITLDLFEALQVRFSSRSMFHVFCKMKIVTSHKGGDQASCPKRHMGRGAGGC